MSERVRIGIIGTGGIAQAYANAYHQIPEANIVGLCDIVPGKAKRFGEKREFAEARCYEDYTKMIKELDLDAVSVSTYNAQHAGPAIGCLEAGLHVICEKPMSVTLDESVRMARAAKKSGKILTIGFQPRYDPNMQLVKQIVQSGQLGKIYYVETGGGRRRGMPWGTFIKKDTACFGAIADIGCYSLDMVMNSLGYPKPLSVSAVSGDHFGKNPKYNGGNDPKEFGVEDFGAAFIRLEGDITVLFKISWAMHMDTLGAAYFLGSEAGLKLTPAGSGDWAGAWDGGVGSITLYHDLYDSRTETPIPPRHRDFDLFTTKVRDFVMSARDGKAAPIPGEQIVRNQAIIDGILRSSASRQEVKIDIPQI